MSRKKTHNSMFSVFTRNINSLIDEYCGGNKKAFGEAVNVHYDTVRRWCNGVNLPEGTDLLMIHQKYGVSIDWLLTGTESTPNQTSKISESAAHYCTEEEFMAQWPEEIKNACRQLKEILLSDHPVIKPALISNLAAFQYSVQKEASQDEQIRELNTRLLMLEKLLRAESRTGTDEAASSSTGKQKT